MRSPRAHAGLIDVAAAAREDLSLLRGLHESSRGRRSILAVVAGDLRVGTDPRFRSCSPLPAWVTMMRSGAWPEDFQALRKATRSKRYVSACSYSSPKQWSIPGTMNSRTESRTLSSPSLRTMLS